MQVNLSDSEWKLMNRLARPPSSCRTAPLASSRASMVITVFLLQPVSSFREAVSSMMVRGDCSHSRFFPAVDREDAAAAETESFLSRVYGGSLGLMMSAMVESRQLTEADIAELSAILERAGGEEHA